MLDSCVLPSSCVRQRLLALVGGRVRHFPVLSAGCLCGLGVISNSPVCHCPLLFSVAAQFACVIVRYCSRLRRNSPVSLSTVVLGCGAIRLCYCPVLFSATALRSSSSSSSRQRRGHRGRGRPRGLIRWRLLAFAGVVFLTTVAIAFASSVLFDVILQELWGWLEPYMDDEEEFKPSPTEGNMTMGQFVRKIIRWAI